MPYLVLLRRSLPIKTQASARVQKPPPARAHDTPRARAGGRGAWKRSRGTAARQRHGAARGTRRWRASARRTHLRGEGDSGGRVRASVR